MNDAMRETAADYQTEIDAARKAVGERQRDAALKQILEQGNRRRLVLDALDLTLANRAGDVIHLDDTTSIVEIVDSAFKRTTYAVVFGNRRPNVWQTSLDQALLYAVQLRNGGQRDDDAYLYAGRVLRIREDEV
jgi:hypothetical protein